MDASGEPGPPLATLGQRILAQVVDAFPAFGIFMLLIAGIGDAPDRLHWAQAPTRMDSRLPQACPSEAVREALAPPSAREADVSCRTVVP
jgi:hypothetical protein